MRSFATILSLGLVGLASSLDMALYKEQGGGIDAGFRAYLTEYVSFLPLGENGSYTHHSRLYLMTEDPAVTTDFSDFFTADGELIVRGIVATGSDEIIALKQRLLPTAGNKHWNHRPNVTTVDSESSTQKVFNVLGVIEATYDGGNCSQA